MKRYLVLLTVAFALSFAQGLSAQNLKSTDVPRILSYQGHITNADQSVTGVHPITVRLYTDPEGKNKLWEDTYTTDVKDGIFSVLLGSQTALPTTERLNRPVWLGVSVSGSDELRPLTQFTAALYALNVPDKSITKEKLSDELQTTLLGTAGGSQLPQAPPNWTRTGDAYNAAAGDYVGTDGTGGDLEIRVQNERVFYFQNTVQTPDIIGGYVNNAITSSVLYGGNTISGGGFFEVPAAGGDHPNTIDNSYCATIGGGNLNTIINGESQTISGGRKNRARDKYSVVGGGLCNYAYANSSTISGGFHNFTNLGCDTSGIFSGSLNKIDGSAQLGFIGGGHGNLIVGSRSGVIAGGFANFIGSITLLPTYDFSSIGTGTGNYSSISGGVGNVVSGRFGAVSGGRDNKISSNTADYSAINGGNSHRITGSYSLIGGGLSNIIESNYAGISSGSSNFIGIGTPPTSSSASSSDAYASYIGGGVLNVVKSQRSSISGGQENKIDNSTAYNSYIGGGKLNQIALRYGGIGSGELNLIHNTTSNPYDDPTKTGHDFIGGGLSNSTLGSLNIIGGGELNRIGKVDIITPIIVNYSVIAGGEKNIVEGTGSSVVGGISNTIKESSNSLIGGGTLNTINSTATLSVIGGGSTNTINSTADHTFIGGGFTNTIESGTLKATILGGSQNTIKANSLYSTIGGGIGNTVTAENAAISGGSSIQLSSDWAVVGGGFLNTISTGSETSFIGAGWANQLQGVASVIAGGFDNRMNIINNGYSVIGGGAGNKVDAPRSTITGGTQNHIVLGANDAAIGGGSSNMVASEFSTIPGGRHLIAQSYGQTVLGVFNKNKGSSVAPDFNIIPMLLPKGDEPLLIIGNGNSLTLSNAFEVSNNGHSTVYDVNGQTRIPIRGATYTDNIIYAWGTIDPPDQANIPDELDEEFSYMANCAFGVTNVTLRRENVTPVHYSYKVQIAVNDPDGNALDLSCSAITANAINDDHEMCTCPTITSVSRMQPGNFFWVKIWNLESCHQSDPLPFMFMVTGRPQAQ